jgi:NIPSNAP
LTPARAFPKDARLTCAAWRRRQREDSVLVDHRYYHIKPGMVGAHLDLYEKHGFAAQTRHLGQPLAYMYTESGEVNTLVHIWCYDDPNDRMQKRAAMWKDPEWVSYAKQMADSGYLVSQRNNLMIPAKFAPIKR